MIKMILALVTLSLLSFFTVSEAANIGIGFSTGGPYDVPLGQMKSKGVYILKMWNYQGDMLDQMEITYASDSLDVTVAIPNFELASAAGNNQAYMNNVLAYLMKHRRIIKLVAVGNEPFLEANRAQAMPYIEDAFNNIVKLVANNGLANDMKVTIPFSFDVVTNTNPPSNAVFHPNIIALMRRVTSTMISTGSKFSINIYPYWSYYYDSAIPLDYAIGRSGSLFEDQVRACRAALNNIGVTSLPIIIGETGWPSAGGKDASVANMQTYTNYIVNFARSTSLVAAIYIFEAYDESWKPGEGVEKNWGLYYEQSRTPKFNFDIASYGGSTGAVNWNGNDWALKCDFKNQDMSNAQVASSQCGPRCLATSGCTHYTWTSYNGGTCWMKKGLVTKADAFFVSSSDYVCGVNPIVWIGNNEAVACDFKGNGLTNALTAKADCAAKCKGTSGCTHYTWNTYNGGTCWMMSGTVTKSDAYYTGDLNAVCGIGGTTGIVWNGKWAFNCDFNNHDMGNAQVPGEQCSSKCAATAGCTHFTWTTYNGGTCWMKKDPVTKADAFYVNDSTMVCGLL